jgi:hypothetical protein
LLPDEFCEEFPHNLIPTPGYWIECSRQKITSDTIWDESESEREEDGGEPEPEGAEGGDEIRIRHDMLLEDEEDDEEQPRYSDNNYYNYLNLV